jgi:hypothetical protein
LEGINPGIHSRVKVFLNLPAENVEAGTVEGSAATRPGVIKAANNPEGKSA